MPTFFSTNTLNSCGSCGQMFGRVAIKLARICYATLRDKQCFDEQARLNKKLARQAFAMPA